MGRFMGRFIVGLRYKIEIYGLIFETKNPKYDRYKFCKMAGRFCQNKVSLLKIDGLWLVL